MYPKNAASPEKIPIGPVVQISDGEVQTSGVTVRIIPTGVAEGDGAGTTAYSTDGVVLYTPTQAETNYASFILIAKKTGCIPASQLVVPTESAVAGRVSLGAILGTALSEGAAGRIAAAWQAAWNVASSVWTSASVNQTGDSYTIVNNGTHGSAALKTDLDKVPKSDGTVAFNATAVSGIQSGLATSANVTSILNAISGLNNLSALANLYGPPLLEIPDSGDPDAVYAFTLVVRDNEGKLVALDGSPAIAAANAAGTDRSTNLSAVSNPATGRYTFTYSVADDATPESLRITCSGTVSAEARYVEWVGAVVDYDTLTTLLAVKAKTDNLPAAPASTSDVTGARDQVLTRLGTPADTDLATDIANLQATADALPTPSEVQQKVQDAIEANHLDHLFAVAYDPASKPGAADALLNELVGSDAGVSQFTANALELAPSGGGSAPTVEQIDAELSANHGAGSWEGGSGGAGTGARTVTFTVNDGTDPLQNAVVRVIQGAENYTSMTNASGVAVLALNDATWSYAVTKPGYDGETGSLIVNGTEALTVSLDATVVTPPTSPSLSAIEVLCLDSAGQIEVGVDVDIRMVSIPSGSQNIAFKGAKQTATSDADGIARFEVVQGSICEWKRGAADVWQRISVDSDGVTNATSVIGSP